MQNEQQRKQQLLTALVTDLATEVTQAINAGDSQTANQLLPVLDTATQQAIANRNPGGTR